MNEELILRIAKRIQFIEHGGRHTWDSCMQSARLRAIEQAKAALDELVISLVQHKPDEEQRA